MPTKRTTPTAAPAAKPTTAKEALEAGHKAYEDAAAGSRTYAALEARLETASTYANTVVDAINAELRMQFEKFISEDASAADALLMRDLLSKYSEVRREGGLEVSLPGAFAQAMNGALVCVPDDIDIDWQRLIKSLGEAHYRNLIFPCLDALAAHSGCTSPAEEFVRAVLSAYNSRYLTPDNAAHDLEEFRENYTLMSKWAAVFMENKQPPCVETPAHPKGEAHA